MGGVEDQLAQPCDLSGERAERCAGTDSFEGMPAVRISSMHYLGRGVRISEGGGQHLPYRESCRAARR